MASFFKKIGGFIKGLAPTLGGLIPGVGALVGPAIGGMIQAKEQKKMQKAALRAGAGAGGGVAVDTARVSGGVLGGGLVAGGGAVGQVGAPAPGAAPGTDLEKAYAVVAELLYGASDGAVRSKARTVGISGKKVLDQMTQIEGVWLMNRATGQAVFQQLSALERMAVSNELERIFKAGRRRRGLVPKSVKRFLKMASAVKKLVGVAHTIKVKGKKK